MPLYAAGQNLSSVVRSEALSGLCEFGIFLMITRRAYGGGAFGVAMRRAGRELDHGGERFVWAKCSRSFDATPQKRSATG